MIAGLRRTAADFIDTVKRVWSGPERELTPADLLAAVEAEREVFDPPELPYKPPGVSTVTAMADQVRDRMAAKARHPSVLVQMQDWDTSRLIAEAERLLLGMGPDQSWPSSRYLAAFVLALRDRAAQFRAEGD